MTPSPTLNIGFITGGQLARMMIESVRDYPQRMNFFALDEYEEGPCTGLAQIIKGSSLKYEDVLAFGQKMDLVILEFEHVNVEALESLQKQGMKILCQPAQLRMIQDKGIQKEFLQSHGLPTAPFELADSKEDLKKWAHKLPFVQKTRRHGYDGGGVKILRTAEDFEKALEGPSLMEEMVAIEKEFSVIVGRDALGKTFRYPLAEQFFHPEGNIVEFIAAPAQVSPSVQSQIDAIESAFLEAFGGEGLWAIELFLDQSGKVLVNEISPRVHNSGHHTIEANDTSQFEQFMRLALGLPCGSTALISPAVTVNLLGSQAGSGIAAYEGLQDVLQFPQTHVHFYGKPATKPFRKMGHVTVKADTLEQAWKIARKVKETLRVMPAHG